MVIMILLKKLADTYHLDSCQLQKLTDFIELLQVWNRIHNLTAICHVDKVIIYHLWDSLSTMPYLTGKIILDLGTGAGLPGIPLAIAFPNKQFVLLDSNAKKICFCRQLLTKVKLNNVKIIQIRAEYWQTKLRFNHIMTRALGTINYIIKISQHLCHPQGTFLIMKASIPLLELENLSEDFIYRIHTLVVPGMKKRHLIDVRKRLCDQK